MTLAADQPVYAFGDSELAAQRLQFLAEVFAPSTRCFIQELRLSPINLAVDVGCGPGVTTHQLAALLPCDCIVGLDISDRFVSLAMQTAGGRVSFCRHDFTDVPFPMGPADLIYARYVLTHMADPERVLYGWASQLRPGGLQLVEETEWIRTSSPAFALYLNIVERMLAEQSNILYIGAWLASVSERPLLRTRSSVVRRLQVDARDAARMFGMNIQTWKQHPFIRVTYPSAQIEDLQQELESLAGEPRDGVEIEWGLRQMVLERI